MMSDRMAVTGIHMCPLDIKHQSQKPVFSFLLFASLSFDCARLRPRLWAAQIIGKLSINRVWVDRRPHTLIDGGKKEKRKKERYQSCRVAIEDCFY